MQKPKNKPNPQWKRQRRLSLFWLALCSAMVLITVVPFEAIVWPDVLQGDDQNSCQVYADEWANMECRIMSHQHEEPFSNITRIPFFGTLVGIALMMFPLFYLIPATVLSGITGAMLYRDWRRLAYWEVVLSIAILMLAAGLCAYLYLSPQSNFYFMWLWD